MTTDNHRSADAEPTEESNAAINARISAAANSQLIAVRLRALDRTAVVLDEAGQPFTLAD